MTKNINFKAAVLTEQQKPLELLTNVQVPILKEGQILVKLAYSGVCHSQIMEIDGHRGEDKFLPHLLGHEGSGLVVDVGLNVSKIKKDDTVILTWIKGDGLEAGGVKYQSNERVINAGGVTTFNEYAVVSENRCVNIPSFALKPDDIINVREKSKKMDLFQDSLRTLQGDNPMPWLQIDKAKLTGKFISIPDRDEITEPLNEQLVVELYSK